MEQLIQEKDKEIEALSAELGRIENEFTLR